MVFTGMITLMKVKYILFLYGFNLDLTEAGYFI